MNKQDILNKHKASKGKIETKAKVQFNTKEDLATYYSPGIALPCLEIKQNPNEVYTYTNKGNNMAVISDGSAILGLGNIGPLAGLPVIEAKSAVLKQLTNIDVMPICVGSQETKDIINFCKMLAPSVSAIMLEDIAAPRCVEIERTLDAELDIPVFHDDQHGTAIVLAAALLNSLKIVKKDIADITVVLSGTGAAGSSIIKMLHYLGVQNIIACNLKGVVSKDNPQAGSYNFLTLELLEILNKNYTYCKGDLSEALVNADVFIGVSVANLLTPEMLKTMAKNPIIYALANPEPEIQPSLAIEHGAAVVGTGRSDYPNQINNILAFPGLFKGLLQAKARQVTMDIKVAVAKAIAGMVSDAELSKDYIIPNPLNKDVVDVVCNAVVKAVNESKAK